MAYDLSDKLVIGISSRALFNLERENAIFESKGVDVYSSYQRDNEDVPLEPGTAYPLVQALLHLNSLIDGKRLVEVVVISRNTPDTGLRAFNAIETHGLDISRAVFAGGRESLAEYLQAFAVDLFLSKSASDVQAAIDTGVAAAQLYDLPPGFSVPNKQIRIAFDGDAVLFASESERFYKEHGLEKFAKRERRLRRKAMGKGPFAKLLITLSTLQKQFPRDACPVRIAIVTARSSPAHARVIHTLREWGVSVDEAFFLGGLPKDKVLNAFGAHMFFDDQEVHVQAAATVVPAGKVPYEGGALNPGHQRKPCGESLHRKSE